jgi:rSAM/selenodomain-associated transferase 2
VAVLSIVIPTLDAAQDLERTLAALAPAREDRLVGEVVIADAGSEDATPALAAAWGACLISAPPGRGAQLVAGADAASGDWLLFLHADTVLERGCAAAAGTFIETVGKADRAAVFRFAVDDTDPAARRLEALVAWRNRVLALPYGDQGLLISRGFYDRLGGFRPLPLMEDVDIVRRIGAARLEVLAPAAVTSAERYRRTGYVRRSLRNLACLGLYFLGVPPRLLVRLYG